MGCRGMGTEIGAGLSGTRTEPNLYRTVSTATANSLFSKDESLTHVQVDGFARFHLRAGRNEISTTSHAVHQRLLVVDIEPRPKAGAHMVGFQVSYTDEERQFHQLDFTNSTQTHR